MMQSLAEFSFTRPALRPGLQMTLRDGVETVLVDEVW